MVDAPNATILDLKVLLLQFHSKWQALEKNLNEMKGLIMEIEKPDDTTKYILTKFTLMVLKIPETLLQISKRLQTGRSWLHRNR